MARTDTTDQAHQAYIGLGANLGDPLSALADAMRALDALPGTRLTARSSPYRTAPLDATGPDFINAVVRLSTELEPAALLAALHSIEASAGRERSFRNAPRTLDLDLLLYDKLRLDSTALTVPHPRMHLRAFVLAPLAEIEPDLNLEPHGPVRFLLAALNDQPIERLESFPREQ